MRPTPEQMVIVTLVSDESDLQLSQEPRDWRTWSVAERKARRGHGVRVIYLDAEAERQARKALSA